MLDEKELQLCEFGGGLLLSAISDEKHARWGGGGMRED